MDFKEHFYTSDANSLGALKYTTNKFYRVSGQSTQMKGVESDIVLPSTYDFMELGEASLDNAMPWDTNYPAEYDKLNRVQPYLGELKKRSDARIAADQDFAYVREDIDREKKIMADKSISLNEMQRLKEAEENEARERGRQQEIKSRKRPDEKVYKITLKQVDDPGLPKPVDLTDAKADAGGDTGGAEVASSEGDDSVTPKGSDTADLAPEERAPLEEAEHILVDYIGLLHARSTITAQDQQAKPAGN